MSDETILFLLFGIFSIAGFGLIVGGAISFFRTWRFLWRSVVTSGVVPNMIKSSKGMLAPRVKFTTPEGETITFVHPVSSRPPSYRTGQTITVRYQPGRPHEARINTFFGVWLTPLILLFMGLVFTLAAGFVMMSKLG